MRILPFAFNLDWFRISHHNAIRHINNEVYLCALFIPAFPVVIELLIFWGKLLQFMTDEKACYMVVVIRTAESLKVMEVILDQLNLVCSCFVLVLKKRLTRLLTLCEIGLWVYILQDLDERFTADVADAIICLFRLASEETNICWCLCTFLSLTLHLVKEL